MYYIDQYIHDKQKTCVILSNDTLDIEQYCTMHVITVEQYKHYIILYSFLFPGSRTPSQDYYFMYNIWQDAGIRTRVAAITARCATNEPHASLMRYTHSQWATHIPCEWYCAIQYSGWYWAIPCMILNKKTWMKLHQCHAWYWAMSNAFS